MLKSLNQTLRGYDNFGVPLSLNINKQQEYKSVCGGVLSVMMTVVLIYILVSGLIGVFNRDTYTIEVQQLQDMDPDLKEMNSNNFMFAIKLDNPFADHFPNLNKTAFIPNIKLITLLNQFQCSKSQCQVLQHLNESSLYRDNFKWKKNQKNHKVLYVGELYYKVIENYLIFK